MMDFFKNMNLLPKNFIVANIVDTLKDDPETGAEKVFEMADKFIKDESTLAILDQVKDVYYTRPAIRMYCKNLIYNTSKTCLNHFVQNIVVKALLEGLPKREQLSEKHGVKIPHGLVLNLDNLAEVNRLVEQAKELGIHVIILTQDQESLIKVYEKHLDMQFFVITDSVSLTPKRCERLANIGNVVPVIQYIEGGPSLSHLKASGLLYGLVTHTHLENFQHITSDGFVLPCIRQGSRFHWYMTSTLESSDSQSVLQFKNRIDYIRQMRPYLTLHIETNQQLSEGNISGNFVVEEVVHQTKQRIVLPEVNAKNSQGKRLIQLF